MEGELNFQEMKIGRNILKVISDDEKKMKLLGDMTSRQTCRWNGFDGMILSH